MVISMLKIRRPLGRLIFNMGIAIPGKTVFLIETAPWAVPLITTVTESFHNSTVILDMTDITQYDYDQMITKPSPKFIVRDTS